MDSQCSGQTGAVLKPFLLQAVKVGRRPCFPVMMWGGGRGPSTGVYQHVCAPAAGRCEPGPAVRASGLSPVYLSRSSHALDLFWLTRERGRDVIGFYLKAAGQKRGRSLPLQLRTRLLQRHKAASPSELINASVPFSHKQRGRQEIPLQCYPYARDPPGFWLYRIGFAGQWTGQILPTELSKIRAILQKAGFCVVFLTER